jgi:hypothetical protein
VKLVRKVLTVVEDTQLVVAIALATGGRPHARIGER